MSKNNKLSLKNRKLTFRKLNNIHPAKPTGMTAGTPLCDPQLLVTSGVSGTRDPPHRQSDECSKNLIDTKHQVAPPKGRDQALISLPPNRHTTPPPVGPTFVTASHLLASTSVHLTGARVNPHVGTRPTTPHECVEDSIDGLVTLPTPSLSHK